MLEGVSVVVAGAGLAGLAAARALEARGARVTVVEARDRVGGRLWTLRDAFARRQHAEAGADLIDGEQEAVFALARALGLKPVRVLRRGFAFRRRDGRLQPARFDELERRLARFVEAYRLAEGRGDSPIVARLASVSVARWLDAVGAPAALRARLTGLRGFFLADPEELALVELVALVATSMRTPTPWRFFRIRGGNDQIAMRAAQALAGRVLLNTEALGVRQHATGVRVVVRGADGRLGELDAAFAVLALPATAVRNLAFDPPLPDPQREAFARLRYGRAVRTLLQFDRPFWRRAGRPRAISTDTDLGTLWDGNEEQRGRPGILSLLAGGSAADATGRRLREAGVEGLVADLAWLGARRARLIAHRVVDWTADPWVRGGYAVFDPSYDPAWRPWLARPAGRVFFAGEHTSGGWQGYLNGAVESGYRAATEISIVTTSGLTIFV